MTTVTVEYVLTHAEDTVNLVKRLETDLVLANARIAELSTPAPAKKKWWQK